MAKLLTTQDMIEGHLDTQTLKEAVNEDKFITSRLGKEYASVPMVSRLLVENGLLGATPFSTYAAMTASTLADGDYAVVTNDTDLAKNGVYERNGGAWVYSEYNVQKLVNDISNVVKPAGDSLQIVDDIGFKVGSLSADSFEINNLFSFNASDNSVITDSLGFVINSEKTATEKLPVSLGELLFVSKLCVFDNSSISIDIPSLVKERGQVYDTNQLTATIINNFSSTNKPYVATSSRQLTLETEKLSNDAYFVLHDNAQDNIANIKLSIRKPSGVASPKILMIGDSITNRGLGDLLNQYLIENSITPTWIGTMVGAGSDQPSGDITGVLGEGREGWKAEDYTYQVTNRVQPIPVGDESAYISTEKSGKRISNPFLRASTDADSADIKRNGYVFDAAFYQSRFNLDTPDIVFIQLGTNDIRDLNNPELKEQFELNMRIIIEQCHEAWPSAKIILSMPGTANDVDRNKLWSSEYHPILRTLINFGNIYNYVIICPTWALMTADAGFVMATSSATTDNVTTALVGRYTDSIHPSYGARLQMAKSIAGYIACAATNQI